MHHFEIEWTKVDKSLGRLCGKLCSKKKLRINMLDRLEQSYKLFFNTIAYGRGSNRVTAFVLCITQYVAASAIFGVYVVTKQKKV